MKLSKRKKITTFIVVLIGIFIAINFTFIWDNIKFTFWPPKVNAPVVVDTSLNSASATPAQSNSVKNSITANMKASTLVVPSLGIHVPIVYATEVNEESFQKALINGVAHYPDTANAGELGNVYIFGHSSDYITSKGNYKHVFSLLPRVKIGAEIFITDKNGNKFIYTVYNSRKVAADDVSVLSQQDYKKKLLTLQTSYPIGTALARWVVVAEIKN